MHPPTPGRSRYELREILGRGGMGMIYRAYDTLMKREVALKTILDVQSKAALDLFYREWRLQAMITHPNIAEIYDIGEMQHEGAVHPYFVMPLLKGSTLADLIRTSSARLTPERAIGMIAQVCRGLQAAHDHNLIHRDLKPSNIFVLDDDAVKLIDFGIAHAESSAQTSVRGTLAYMAPELLQMKPASVATDIYAVGVLSYEALTRRRPFDAPNEAEISRAILHQNPPPISELLPSIPLNVSRAIHKAMAKQPWHRYGSAREFGETLDRALRGDPIEIFAPGKVLPRVERASRAFERGEYVVATEILNELESEGHIEQEITSLRRRVEQAQRQVTVRGLLESARRFAEEEEFALALRKIQESLDLDPENTDAHALKNEVEKQRRAKKVEEWAALARQHLDNNSFAHARSAVKSLLELRPNEPSALALLEEIERREQEFDSLRQEKSRLVLNARGAWERGEVTSALTQLEKWVNLEHQAPETDAERMVSLQNFYNQVRGEHESIKNSYEQARQLLAQGEFGASLEICNQFLAKYPNHALFKALQYDVEDRKRQNLSALVAETDRRVDSEPDLDRRVAILEEAQRQYPEEPHFERALKLTRDKRDLVASVVSRARLHEDEGRFAEALDQWEVLRAVHGSYPGLDFEIDRLKKRREGQARVDARAKWAAQIDRLMEAREYERAAAVATQALAEFAGDQEFEQLLKMAQYKRSRLAEAMGLLERGRASAAEGRLDDALEAMRAAREIEPASPSITSALVHTLALQAQALAESDPEAAEALLNQILEIDPGHTIGLNLRALRSDREKEEFITWCGSQARKLQAEGDLEGALVLVQQGLERYPNDVRLNQLYSVLDRSAQTESRKQATPEQEAPPASMLPPPTLASGPLDSPATATMVFPGLRPPETQAASAPTPPQQLAPTVDAGARPATTVPPPATTVPPTARPKRSLAARVNSSRVVRLALLGGAAVILAVSVFAIWKNMQPKAAQAVRVDIRTVPTGARVSVGDQEKGTSNLSLELAPGEYRVAAELEGYRPAFGTYSVQPGAAMGIDFALQPWKPAVRVFSEADVGQATLSERALNPGAPGEFMLDGLEDGAYNLKVSSQQGEVSAGLRVAALTVPLLAEPIQQRNLTGLLIHEYGTRVVVYAANPAAKAGLDGQAAAPIPATGLALQDVKPGPHQLSFDDGVTTRTVSFTMSPAPAVHLYVLGNTEAGRGTLVVNVGQDNATVLVNGRAVQFKTRAGLLRLPGIPFGSYKVAVQKDGFEAVAPQTVELKATGETKVEFKLKEIVNTATLRIQGAAGAQVLLDNQAAGELDGAGGFSLKLSPGTHSIKLHKGVADSRVFTRDFKAGETVTVGAELALVQPNGTVQFTMSPAAMSLTIRPAGTPDSQARALTQNPASLAEGNYTVTATAAGYTTRELSVSVQPGAYQTVNITLRQSEEAAAQKRQATVETHGMAEFPDAKSWTADGDWMMRKGGKYVPYRLLGPGTVTFQIKQVKGKRLQWFVHYSDPQNHILYRLDRKSLYRLTVVNGHQSEPVKFDHNVDASVYEVRITIAPERIVHELKGPAGWVTLDTYQEKADLSAGRFGFFVPDTMMSGMDEYAVRGFSYTSRPR